MYENLKISTVECLENGNNHMYRKLFPGEQHFFSNGSQRQKIARIRKQTEYNQRKLTEFSNYVHYQPII